MKSTSGAALLLLAAPFVAWAQTGPAPGPAPQAHPYAGPYVIVGGGRNEYERHCGFIVGPCYTGRSSAFKIGGGMRFGVSALEAWYIDFGGGRFQGDSFWGTTPFTARVRMFGVGAAWAARLGRSFELTSRVGAANSRFITAGEPHNDTLQPYAGVTLGVRAGEQAAIELGFDITRARRNSGESVVATAIMAGARFRF